MQVLTLALALVLTASASAADAPGAPKPLRLYWFIPDGMRTDPDVFNIYRWAREGKMPNLRKMMERGTYGYARPVFPSHTPANFATLFTGAYPEVHGINDGPMRTEGNPLNQVSVGGFSSVAKKVDPIWVTLEKQFSPNIVLLSVPGSTPPELKKGITVRGRWGRWGADFHAVNFQDSDTSVLTNGDPAAGRLFYQGPRLTQPAAKTPATGWGSRFTSHSPAWEAALSAWGATVYAYFADGTDNRRVDYDTIFFSTNKTEELCRVRAGAWSDWAPLTLQWQIPGQPLARAVPTSVKIKVIRLETNGAFRVRFLFNNLNKHLADPDYVAEEILKGAGPMVDFVDNFPPQLIHFPEDKATFLEEADLSLNWHRDAATFLLRRYQPRVYIQDTYTPNQMLTSRWWLGHVDPLSARYQQVSATEREQLWREVHGMYAKLDEILGALLAQADENTVVVLSSDHGAIPLDTSVRLNNLFAREGLLKFRIDATTRERVIDWAATKAVYLQMHNVYLNPAGLGGNWTRATGVAYEQLRQRVMGLLLDLATKDGLKPVEKVVEWEQASAQFHLYPGRAGDLIIANRAGFGWSEEMTADGEIFSTPLISGYKQAIMSERVKGLWTPFVVVGPGVKQGHFLGDQPLEMVDEYPTILRCLGVEPPAWVQGRVVTQLFTDRSK